jgi:Ricin-type beta-trefoil lectin domain
MSFRRARRIAATALISAVAAVLMAQPAFAIDTNLKYEMDPQHDSAMCIGVAGGSSNDGAHIQQFACDHRANQRLTFERLPFNNDVYRLHPTNSNKCMALEGRKTTNGTHLVQTTCAVDFAQLFRIVNDKNQAGLSGAQISSTLADDKRCLDVAGASNASGAQLVLFDCGTQPNQRFDLLAAA